ncbi:MULTISPECIES: type VII secretion target [unclassified Nocardia]|uniref:type VII secretion target n=1 Tax=unclassified Nocardia TaxID=2637762 RepID=UPI00278C64A6|nr:MULTISPECIES: type VII secretion target [unclassified Nocardia]
MYDLTVDPTGMTTYATATNLRAADLTAAATRAAPASPPLLAPRFGLLAPDLLAAYTAAHTTHLTTISALAAVLTTMAGTATGSATTYTALDGARAAGLRPTTGEMSA